MRREAKCDCAAPRGEAALWRAGRYRYRPCVARRLGREKEYRPAAAARKALPIAPVTTASEQRQFEFPNAKKNATPAARTRRAAGRLAVESEVFGRLCRSAN